MGTVKPHEIVHGRESDLGYIDADETSLIALHFDVKQQWLGEGVSPDEEYELLIYKPWTGKNVKVETDTQLREIVLQFEEKKLERMNAQWSLVSLHKEFFNDEQFLMLNGPENEGQSDVDGNQYLGLEELDAIPSEQSSDDECIALAGDDDGGRAMEEDEPNGSNSNLQADSDSDYDKDGLLSDCESEDGPAHEETLSDEETPLGQLHDSMNGKLFKLEAEGEIEFKVGDLFLNIAEVRNVVEDYAVQRCFELDKKKNNNYRYTTKCKTVDCPWHFHASRLPGQSTFELKKLHPHENCVPVLKNKSVTAKWISSPFSNDFRMNPNMSIRDFKEELQRRHGIQVTQHKR